MGKPQEAASAETGTVKKRMEPTETDGHGRVPEFTQLCRSIDRLPSHRDTAGDPVAGLRGSAASHPPAFNRVFSSREEGSRVAGVHFL